MPTTDKMNDYAQQTSVSSGIPSSPTTSCNSAATMAAAAAAHFYQQQQHLHAAAAAAAAMDHNPTGHHHQPLAAAAAVAAAAVGSVDTPRYPWMSITGESLLFLGLPPRHLIRDSTFPLIGSFPFPSSSSSSSPVSTHPPLIPYMVFFSRVCMRMCVCVCVSVYRGSGVEDSAEAFPYDASMLISLSPSFPVCV